jgi:hypothetical protein
MKKLLFTLFLSFNSFAFAGVSVGVNIPLVTPIYYNQPPIYYNQPPVVYSPPPVVYSESNYGYTAPLVTLGEKSRS